MVGLRFHPWQPPPLLKDPPSRNMLFGFDVSDPNPALIQVLTLVKQIFLSRYLAWSKLSSAKWLNFITRFLVKRVWCQELSMSLGFVVGDPNQGSDAGVADFLVGVVGLVKSDLGEVVKFSHYQVSCKLLLGLLLCYLISVTACNLMAALTAFCVKVKVADQDFAGSNRGLSTGFFARNFRSPVRKLASQKFL